MLCGISDCFRSLFPSERQVAHALLARPPLSDLPKEITPFDLHVLGMPPAFVLSQDQTLQCGIYTAFRLYISIEAFEALFECLAFMLRLFVADGLSPSRVS